MKRELLQNTKVASYTSGANISRRTLLSMVLSVTTAVAGALTLTFEHSDDGTTFTPVTDLKLMPLESVATDASKNPKPGVYNFTANADENINLDVDLVGCKEFVKITASGAAAAGASLAYALGDPAYAPVE